MFIFLGWIIIGILSFLKVLPLGVLLVWSIFVTLFCLITSMQKHSNLSTWGVIYFVTGIITSVSISLYLFYDYNVLNIILK